MAKYVLNHKYGDTGLVVLGGTVRQILTKLKEHWEDVLDFPDDYTLDTVNNVNYILSKKYKSTKDIMTDYESLIEEDYVFEEVY